ncbi:MAG: HDOD domain-containing protein [Planctomycetes bacterium]|nr:HDOD domain-containing protein [Planctomycetota bacterium]
METLAPGRSLDELVEQTSGLYSLPAVAVDVLALTNDPQVGAADLKRCIEHDPALVVKLLRVVNSALFGLSRPVTDLTQAITLLGVKPLKLLVLGFSLPRSLSDGVQTQVLEAYWRHALTKAVAARHLAEQLRTASGDDAFLAGLLADIGLLVLIQSLGDPYVQVVRRVRHLQRQLDDVERRALGFDHIELTAQLLRRWNMPAALVDAIASSAPHLDASQPTRADREGTLAEILALAEHWALVLVERQDDHLPLLLQRLRQLSAITPEQLTGWSTLVECRVRELGDALSMALPDDLDYAEVITQAHQRLSDNVSQWATELMTAGARRAPRGDDVELGDQVRQLMALAGSPWSALRVGASANASASATVPAGVAAAPPAASVPSTPPQATAPASAVSALEELLDRVQRMSDDCRQARCALSLVLVALDRDDRQRAELGLVQHTSCCQQLAAICRQVDHWGAAMIELSISRFALLLPNADRGQASDCGLHALRCVRDRFAHYQHPVTVSVGVAAAAMVPKNFSGQQLVLAAARCLQAAQVSGNTLKSIEL